MLRQERLQVPVGAANWTGGLVVPVDPKGLVVLVREPASHAARPDPDELAILSDDGFACLYLQPFADARRDRDPRRLGAELAGVLDWADRERGVAHLPQGLFCTGEAVGPGLVAAAMRPEEVRAVVALGGRPSDAGQWLERIECPILLIVGGHDDQGLASCGEAMMRLSSPVRDLVIVPGLATYDDPALAVADPTKLAADWFGRMINLPLAEAPLH